MRRRNNSMLRGTALIVILVTFVLTGCGALDGVAALPAEAQARVAQLRDAVTALDTLESQPMEGQEELPPATEAPLPAISTPLESSMLVGALEDVFTDIYQSVSPSVVFIEVARGGVGLPGQSLQTGSGSGFVWDGLGHIVTNNHVIADADRIRVTFSDGSTALATLVGGNRDSDLAVIRVDVPQERLVPVVMGDSNAVRVGEIAVAIGNPFGLESTMTVGIISGLGRSLPVQSETLGGPTYNIPDVIQTDAPINPGNSGGVLVDDQGEVIGVTTAIASPVRASAGIGFVVPAVIVQQVVPQLISEGSYAVPWLGISGGSLAPEIAEAMDLPAGQRGVLVGEVLPDSPAGEAGLRGSQRQIQIDGFPALVGGDVIISIGDQPVRSFEDLSAYLFRSTQVGQDVTLTVLRDGERLELSATLRARPTQEPLTQAVEAESEGEVARPMWLGIMGQTLVPGIAEAMDLAADQQGVLVGRVMPGSPADAAGLRGSELPVTLDGQEELVGGDVIVGWDGAPITDMDGLRELVSQAEQGEEVVLTVLRNGDRVDLELTLEAGPTP